MAYKIVKTEHNGAKHGTGFLTKQEAKAGSRKRRRQDWKKEISSTEDANPDKDNSRIGVRSFTH